jgi:hypothetical protein
MMSKPFTGYCQGCSNAGCWDVEPSTGAIISFCKRELEEADATEVKLETQDVLEPKEPPVMTVEELKVHLASLTDIEAVKQYAEGETRKTALKAIEDRGEELKLEAKTDEQALGEL